MSNVANIPSPGKRELQKEARRCAIIDAALEEFTTQGFTATKLDDVAIRAGIGKGTIYLYFDSKESLFEEVVRRTLFPGRDQAWSFLEGFEGSASDLLRLHFTNVHNFMHSEKMPAMLAMIMGEAMRFPELSQFFYDEIIRPSQEMVLAIIRKGIASGEFREGGDDIFIQILMAPIMHGSTWNRQFQHVAPIDPEKYSANHIDFILRALRKN